MPHTNAGTRSLPQDPIPVRISLPTSVAFDIGAMHKVIDSLARVTGCERCFSGRHCVFDLERDFIVDPARLEVVAVGQR